MHFQPAFSNIWQFRHRPARIERRVVELVYSGLDSSLVVVDSIAGLEYFLPLLRVVPVHEFVEVVDGVELHGIDEELVGC